MITCPRLEDKLHWLWCFPYGYKGCASSVHTPWLMALSGLCIMTLPVCACGGQHGFHGTAVVGETHPALQLPNISCGDKAEAKQNFWVNAMGEIGTLKKELAVWFPPNNTSLTDAGTHIPIMNNDVYPYNLFFFLVKDSTDIFFSHLLCSSSSSGSLE